MVTGRFLGLVNLSSISETRSGRYSVGDREHGLRGAVVPPLALHRYGDEGVRGLLLNKPIKGRVYIVDEGLEEIGGRQM